MKSIPARTFLHLLGSAGRRAFATFVICVIALTAGFGLCRAQTLPTVKCPPTGILPPGTGEDLIVDTTCRVGGGLYHYNNVNIVNGGHLVFTEGNTLNLKINFWASSILIEYGGSLAAGTPGSPGPPVVPAAPFGTNGGVLTIHLYGKDLGVGASGITCQSNNGATNPPCGIPPDVWSAACVAQVPPNEGCATVPLPGGTLGQLYPAKDIFYKYDSMPFDDGNAAGYFGYKVLAVSEGGSLQLFGKKGATYGAELDPRNAGTSWTRLDGTITAADAGPTLKVAGPVDWQQGDHIVVTSTDYIPAHSEELVIQSISGNTITYATACFLATLPPGAPEPPCKNSPKVQWTHNGVPFDLTSLPARLNIKDPSGSPKTSAETRAAVGLLTRSIQIVSEGDVFGQCFPPTYATDVGAGCSDLDSRTGYYFGAHTIVRQGYAAFQVQGVEFRQLGEGGRLGHYPVHFHMDRVAAPNTFVKDSSINESMTRWITIHGTQQVLLERNVGYLSIGHGFYLEDAVETNNHLYSNLGVFARAAVKDAANPRHVPGILSATPITPNPPTPPNPPALPALDISIRLVSDATQPAVFWMTHGWNDFIGNMAAGAGMCGACFWETPAQICGVSRGEKWTSYASEQTSNRIGTSPLKNFDGNYCSTAMSSFQTVGITQSCPGLVPEGQGQPFNVAVVLNTLAPPANAVPNPPAHPPNVAPQPSCGGAGKDYPFCPGDYYPLIDDGELKHGTLCPATGYCGDETVPECDTSNITNCTVSVINHYTSSFNWAGYNFAAMWLRGRWHMVANSFVSDVQNAGLTLVGGGDYTHSSAIQGFWNLALQTVFVGQTQPTDTAHAFASEQSPFNPSSGLTCDNNTPPNNGGYCLSKAGSISMPYSNFGVSQHIFNIYDGPATEDSNAFLNVKKVPLGTSVPNSFVYHIMPGIPKAAFAEAGVPAGQCYMQNAAIAWKQPNGFYYPPTFRSRNMFFNNVDIRHFVFDPQFKPDTYLTSQSQVGKAYCTNNPVMFDNWSANDRQTVLNDDDGSLTGYAHTTSVNEDAFFKAPVEGPECQSDLAVPVAPPPAPPATTSPGTAKTSPYDYVTTVVYPDSASAAHQTVAQNCGDPDWTSQCTSELCYGVPFYRLYQTGTERSNPATPLAFVRMAGFDLCQRQTMSANHGHFLVDLTSNSMTQLAWGGGNPPVLATPPSLMKPFCPSPPGNPRAQNCIDHNQFKASHTYDFFHVFARKTTEQTLAMYVGPNFDTINGVKLIRVAIKTAPFKVTPEMNFSCHFVATMPPPDPTKPCLFTYNTSNDILTVNLNEAPFAAAFDAAAPSHCTPAVFCVSVGTTCTGTTTGKFSNLSQADQNRACSELGTDPTDPAKIVDMDCPSGGCVGFSVTLPSGFVANNQTATVVTTVDPTKPPPATNPLVKSLTSCFPKDANWNKTPVAANAALAGTCVNAPINSAGDFCP